MELRNKGAVIEETIRTRLLKSFFGAIKKKELLVDLGCGPRPYQYIYREKFERTLGIDHPDAPFPKSGIDIYCSADQILLENDAADVVLSTEMLHDMAEPQKVLHEIYRILKPGGQLIMTTPFLVPVVDGIYDHFRYTRHGLDYLLKSAGFIVGTIEPVGDIFGTAITLMIKPWLRLWNVLSKKTGLKFLYSIYNPILYATVIVPQQTYLLLNNTKLFNRLFKKFNYGSIGYFTIASKPLDHRPK